MEEADWRTREREERLGRKERVGGREKGRRKGGVSKGSKKRCLYIPERKKTSDRNRIGFRRSRRSNEKRRGMSTKSNL